MRPHALFLPTAHDDLRSIWRYTKKHWGEDQAEVYSRNLGATIFRLIDNPNLGPDISAIRQGYRKFASGSHLIIYRKAGDTIEVVRILHASMDIDQQL